MSHSDFDTLMNKLHARLDTRVREEQTLHWAKHHATLSKVASIVNDETDAPLTDVINGIKTAWKKAFDEIHVRHPMNGWEVTASFCKETKSFISAYYTHSTEMVVLSKRLEALFQAEVIAATA